MKETYSPKELAQRWSMTYQNIINLLQKGEVKGFKVGDSWRISKEEVRRIEGGKNGE